MVLDVGEGGRRRHLVPGGVCVGGRYTFPTLVMSPASKAGGWGGRVGGGWVMMGVGTG